MSKNPPTLADQCIATMLDKKLFANGNPNNVELIALFKKIPLARKFVLDCDMSRYFVDLSRTMCRGGLRKRLYQIENSRQLARLPHALTWMEFDYRAMIERARELGLEIKRGPDVGAKEKYPERCGWLLQQHPKIETAFLSTECYSSMIYEGRGMPHPVSIVWCSDNEPLPWRTIKLWRDEDDQSFIAMMKGYRSSQVGWTFSFSEHVSAPMMHGMGSWAIRPTTPCRDLWALLATINDLPIKIEKVEPSHGYMARGSYKKFVTHSVIHLTVPETHWYKLVRKTAAILRRRAHQVRGHWRIDFRQRPVTTCEHDWDEHIVCRKCGGHKLWIAEHQRGDASLGFVIHDYSVERDDGKAA